jgi:hypothetical protein
MEALDLPFATVGEILTCGVMLTGRGGLFGSTPGLFVAIGFCNRNETQDAS